MMKALVFLLLLSCAHKPMGIKEEIENKHISLGSVLDLGRNAYLKGCVDSKNEFAPKLKKSSFKKCLELAKIYEAELFEIMNPESENSQGNMKNEN